MISPDTLPGTVVVAVITINSPPQFAIFEGLTYTVGRILPQPSGRFDVELCEFDHRRIYFEFGHLCRYFFKLEHFSYPKLPDCLTRPLTATDTPVDVEQRAEGPQGRTAVGDVSPGIHGADAPGGLE